MVLPGFSAERSLYATNNVYRSRKTVGEPGLPAEDEAIHDSTCGDELQPRLMQSPELGPIMPCPPGSRKWTICNVNGECFDTCRPVRGTSPSRIPIRRAAPVCDPPCAPGSFCCGVTPESSTGRCVDLSSDNFNCGSCWHPCFAEGGSCCNGQCCTNTCCSTNGRDSCSDTDTDPSNCGTCGNSCATDQYCFGGRCGNADCSGVWTDTSTDALNCGSCGNQCLSGQSCIGGRCTCGIVPTPIPTLFSSPYSNRNYYLNDGCKNIVNATVKFTTTSSMMSNNGFTIQVNADPPSGSDMWQQYAFLIVGNSIRGAINNWRDFSTSVVCDYITLASTPIKNGLPAGFGLTLQLLTDSAENITGAQYIVSDASGTILANKTFLVKDAGCHCTGACVGFSPGNPSPDLAPITNFTVDIVGPGDGQGTTFSSGAGTITYLYGGDGLFPATSKPPCVVSSSVITAETSNAIYGSLNGCPGPIFSQTVSINPRTCTTTFGSCTGARGAESCLMVGSAGQCCHSTLFYGNFPWITTCSDLQTERQGCTGPCY
jgi:hypothetical protein